MLNISINILHNLAKMFWFNSCTRSKDEGRASALAAAIFLPEVPGHLWKQRVEQRAATEEEHKLRGSCQLLKLCRNAENYQGLQPNVQTNQDKIRTINKYCRDNYTKFPTQYSVCHVSPN